MEQQRTIFYAMILMNRARSTNRALQEKGLKRMSDLEERVV